MPYSLKFHGRYKLVQLAVMDKDYVKLLREVNGLLVKVREVIETNGAKC